VTTSNLDEPIACLVIAIFTVRARRARKRFMSNRKVSLVTGASRGIGRACAIELAKRGFDVVVTARTVTGKEFYEYSSSIKRKAEQPLPGSLEETAAEVRAAGGEALVQKLDLAERADWPAAIDATVAHFGRLDVLVNNGRYIGPGHMDVFDDTPLELIERMFLCNVFAPLHLIKLALPSMRRQGGGIVINVTSSAGERETPLLIGEGGWGLGYSVTKAAFNRMIPGLAKELRKDRIAVIGLMPGFVGTERMAIELGAFGFDASKALPTDNPGRVCAMLASARDPMVFTGKDLDGPTFFAEHEGVSFGHPGEDPAGA
jgi:NAD(P)-dependent dehydrogenase (short-subunit alcohol dehydrogenase family)